METTANRPYVLSIAGFDPSGGAGVIADCKTMEAFQTVGLAVTTALTFQTENSFDGVEWLSWSILEKQLEPLVKRYAIEVVKIGLIENLHTLQQVLQFLKSHLPSVYIIWDPILAASAGTSFHQTIDAVELKACLQHIDLITPNLPEMQRLFGATTVQSCELLTTSNTAVLVKGGHATAAVSIDTLFMPDGEQTAFEAARISGFDKHGTGCMLSSAIAAQLAKGVSLNAAIAGAKQFVLQRMQSNPSGLAWYQG